RIEAVTGLNTLALLQRDESMVANAARLVGSTADELIDGVQRRLDEIKSLNDEIKALRSKAAIGQAAELAMKADHGIVVTRVDGTTPADLRELAIAVRRQDGVVAVVLGGVTSTGGVALVAAITPSFGADGQFQAGDLIKDAARAVGGGGGGKGDIATAGGKITERLDEALRLAEDAAASAARRMAGRGSDQPVT
ncbi:MAG: DHHA1 domain-containing protein, partial [Ilumatobacteraceae bacterium]